MTELSEWHLPFGYSDEAEFVRHTVKSELLYLCQFNVWPEYFRKLLLCSDMNLYENRLKIAVFFKLNKFDFKCLSDFIIFLNIHPISSENLEKLLRLEEWLGRDYNLVKHSSFHIWKEKVLFLNGVVRYGTKHNNFGYINCTGLYNHLARYGLEKEIIFENEDPYGNAKR